MKFFSRGKAAAPRSGDTTAAPSVAEQEKNSRSSGSDDEVGAPNALERKIEAIESDADAAANEGADAPIEYPKSTQLILITVALCLSVFCMALDTSIVSTAIPKITDEFDAIDDVGWFGSAYLLCVCAFQLFYGKLYTFFSIKYVYLVAIFIFEVGSAVCGAAPSATALIIGRAIAGLGAAGIFSGAILIVANTVRLEKRPAYMGLIGGMYGVASVAGPLLGGVFTTDVTWRWCFYINLPLGAVTILFIVFFYNPTRAARAQTLSDGGWKAKLAQFDLLGLAIFLPMIVCLLLALQWGGSTYAFSNGRIIALFVLFGVLLVAFVAVQLWKQDLATVPPRVLNQRSIAAASAFIVCVGSAFFTMVYFVPIWFQAIKGNSPVESGIHNLPMVLSVVVASLIGGILTTVVGYYTPFILLSVVFMSIGGGLMTTFHSNTSEAHWLGFQIIFGLGVGFGMQQALVVAQTVLEPRDVPIGTATVMFFQTLGGALFLSVAENVFENKLLAYVAKDVPSIDPETVLAAGATALQTVVPAKDLAAVRVAYSDALDQAFVVGTAMACMALFGAVFVEWRSVKGKKLEMAAA